MIQDDKNKYYVFSIILFSILILLIPNSVYATITNPTAVASVTDGAAEPKINLSGLADGGTTNTVIFPVHPITVNTATADIVFPASVVADNLPNDEIIEISISTKTANSAVLPAGEVTGTIIELGDPIKTITFDAMVKVTLLGEAGNTPFIVTFTQTVLVSACTDGSVTTTLAPQV